MHFYENFYDNKINFKYLEYQQDIKTDFEALDEKLFISKPKYLYSIGKFERTIITPYGVITFKRRKYRYWNNGKWKYLSLVDNEIGLSKYERITKEFKIKILNAISDGKRQKDILDVYKMANISKMSISNTIRSFKNNKLYKICKADINEKNKVDLKNKILYIQLDETFLKLKDINEIRKYKIRLATFHTGYAKDSRFSKRPKLENKRAFYLKKVVRTTINTEDYLNLIMKELNFFYKNIDIKNIVVCGDGAKWIRSFAEFYNFRYILDKFHLLRILKLCWYSNKKHIEWKSFIELISKYNEGNVKRMIEILKEWLILAIDLKGKERISESIVYIRNNKNGIHSQDIEWNIGCSIESDISHLIKSALGYGTKIYNKHIFKNIMDLRIAKVNKLEILKYYQKELAIRNEENKNEFRRLKYIRITNNNESSVTKQGKTYKKPLRLWMNN